MYERQLLRELEALRVDVSNANNKVAPITNGVPKPTIVPPLEDFSQPPRPPPNPRPESTPPNGTRSAQPLPPSANIYSRQGPLSSSSTQASFARDGTSSPSFMQSPRLEPPSSSSAQSFASRQGPLSASSSQTFARQSLPPQSPGAGPSSAGPHQITFARPSDDEPPLGGRFVDGTKSMFVKPTSTSSPLGPPVSNSSSSGSSSGPSSGGQMVDPLLGGTISRSSTSSPLVGAPPRGGMNRQDTQSDALDPLGQTTPKYMSQSVRVTPSRPRLDAREAASKLANAF